MKLTGRRGAFGKFCLWWVVSESRRLVLLLLTVTDDAVGRGVVKGVGDLAYMRQSIVNTVTEDGGQIQTFG